MRNFNFSTCPLREEKSLSQRAFSIYTDIRKLQDKDKDLLALIKYIADEDKLEKVLENPQVIKTPVVRNGKQSTLGYQPDIWKGWN